MKISQIEKELDEITNDLLSTKIRVEKRNKSSNKQLYKLAKNTDALHSQLIENLESILFLSTPSEMIRSNEQSFLFWTTQFAEKTQQFIQKFNMKTLFTMWAKLINQRLAGDHVNSSSVFSMQEGIAFLRTKRKQQEKAKLTTKNELDDAENKIKDLTEQYNNLVLIAANKDAAGSFYEQLGSDLYHGLRHNNILQIESIIKSASYATYDKHRLLFAKDNQKINKIIFRPQKTTLQEPAPSTEKDQVQQTHTFEYLATKMIELNQENKSRNSLDKLTLKNSRKRKLDNIKTSNQGLNKPESTTNSIENLKE